MLAPLSAPRRSPPSLSSPTPNLEQLGVSEASAAALPEGLRRQLARFLLRWGGGADALAVLPARDHSPRDRFVRCRALLAAGQVDTARDLARTLLNEPESDAWGQRAVGEVFLALEKPHRADERFRAGRDPAGRARAHLQLGEAQRALEILREAAPGDAEAERARLEALRGVGEETAAQEAALARLYEEERAELLEALGIEAPGPSGEEGAALPSDLPAALERVFGYSGFRPGQEQVIRHLLEGRSVLGLMATGAGKSLCFQLPAALLPGATVVISPLIALMKDQVDGLPPRLYRRATLINSSLEPGEADRRMEALATGEVSLVYAAPERLRQRTFVRALQRRGVSLFVVDEAHCVSLWGHDFRPDYFFIRQVLQDLGRPTVLALTATATPEMQDDIGRQLDVPFQRVNLGVYRPNLTFTVRKVGSEAEKWSALLALLREEQGPAIIYVDRRKLAEELAERMEREGIPAGAYHAGMQRDARDAAQTRFMRGDCRVIAATVAFGMGVDKADVRLVVHYNLSRSLEAYYQEAGRAGRDGLPARCVLLYTSHDRGNLARRAASDRMQVGEVLSLHRTLAAMLRTRSGPVAPEEVERHCGADPTRVRVAVSLLEGLGAVARGYDVPASVWVARPAVREWDGCAADARLQRFTEGIGLNGRGGVSVDSARAAAAAGLDLEALEPALLDWQEAGWIRYRSGPRGMGLHVAIGSRGLEKEVAEALQRMAELDERRLKLLTGYLLGEECRQQALGRYFGSPLPEPCGSCDNCQAGPSRVREGTAVARTSAAGEGFTAEESALYERLRAWRREKAREEGVPAYVVFHDRVLYAIARAQPRSLAALAEVPGVGPAKLHAYGAEVLTLARGRPAEDPC